MFENPSENAHHPNQSSRGLVVEPYPSEKSWSEFVSWDDFSIPFPTVSGKSYKILENHQSDMLYIYH
jgi:hypothetical protein